MGYRGDGDDWFVCGRGHKHWGRFGAAGLLLHHRDARGHEAVLLQHRARWSHHGGTWSLPGGARDSRESATQAALREASEEGGVDASSIRLGGLWCDDHGGWSYDTVVAEATHWLPAAPVGGESTDIRWVWLPDVESFPLHPGLRRTWPALREALVRLTLVVDAANVVGSEPDGWWHDREGAAQLLRDDLVRVARAGVPGSALPATLPCPLLGCWLPDVVLVVEGRARGVAGAPPDVEVVEAAGSGDDALIEVVRELRTRRPRDPVLVVTADRELRARCAVYGAAVVGPRWLDELRDAAGAACAGG
ncbi:MAG: NUDIX domain-containing protein [Actinomycetes bacterium]